MFTTILPAISMSRCRPIFVIFVALWVTCVTPCGSFQLNDDMDAYAGFVDRWRDQNQARGQTLTGWNKLQQKLLNPRQEPGQLSEYCDICELAVVFVNLNIDIGLEYDDVRDAVIEACTLAVPFNKSDVMCPGLIDNYYPALDGILRRSPMDEEEVCGKLNFCYYGNVGLPNQNLPGDRRPLIHQKQFKPIGYTPSSQLSKEDMIKVVQLTDVHIDHEYLTGTATDCGMFLCCREKYEGEGSAGEWGDYPCNTPIRTLELFIRQVALVDKPADFVLYTGDTPPHAMWEETQEIQMNYTEYLTKVLEKILPNNMQVYPTIGNHDMFPTNLFYLEKQHIKDMTAGYSRWWSELAGFTDRQRQTAAGAGYYDILSRDRLRIVSYNTMLPYTQNFYTLLNDETQEYKEMKQWMEQTLAKARVDDEKVVLIGHIPMGALTLGSFSEWFRDLVFQYSDIIVLQVYGHTHRDHFSLFIDQDDDVAKAMYFISPSVTSHTDRNPSARVFWLDPENFSLVDYEQWFFNLTAINESEEEPVLQLMYRASEEYNLANMAPKSWQELVDVFETDDETFNRYYTNHFTKNGLTEKPEVADKVYMLCEMRNPNYAHQQICIFDNINGTSCL